MTPLHIELLVHGCTSSGKFPNRGYPAVEAALGDLRRLDAIELCDAPNMFRATEMGQAWLKLICRTPAPTQAWIDAERRVIE